MPAYFNGTLYYGAAGDVIRAFSIRQAKFSATPVSETTNRFPYPGATPSISTDGSRNRFGPGNKFITPTVANGKVFVGTTDGVAVFGLLH